MCIIDNYSHEYKTRRILDLDKILLSAEENPLHLEELKSLPSSPFQSFSNPFELPKPAKTSIPNQP